MVRLIANDRLTALEGRFDLCLHAEQIDALISQLEIAQRRTADFGWVRFFETFELLETQDGEYLMKSSAMGGNPVKFEDITIRSWCEERGITVVARSPNRFTIIPTTADQAFEFKMAWL